MYDIIFADDKTQKSAETWNELKRKFPTAKKVDFTIGETVAFESARKKAFTKMFWIIWPDLIVDSSFDFSYQADEWSNDYIHVFKNGIYYDGIALFPKHSSVSRNELKTRFFLNKKEVDITASSPLKFDIVFISYQEPNADSNYEKLLKIIPAAKRIHGVKGIHQAHIEAAKQASTEMFWVVDGDAEMVEDFSFDYQVPKWNHDHVHVWRSRNPINDLEYGYGGVKLLPRLLTINMDLNKADMTTSISTKFKSVEQVSNITSFNTDPFNTWKSAFRECAKLASKTIRGQINKETDERLSRWCSAYGRDRLYGDYAISGARAGRKYGNDNVDKPDRLVLINDFDWLKEQFDASCI